MRQVKFSSTHNGAKMYAYLSCTQNSTDARQKHKLSVKTVNLIVNEVC